MARKSIHLLGEITQNEDGKAGATITPGMLLEGVTTLNPHSSAGGDAPRQVALERDELGNEIDVNYAADDQVKVGVFPNGSRAYMWLASGQNAAENAFLESNGDGRLAVFASGVKLFRALEAVDASSGALRIRVESY